MDRTDGIERISGTLGRLRVLIGRRLISRMAMDNLGFTLDLSDLDVLQQIPAEDTGQEVCVGDIARQLRIDPSRASRVVSGLVERGYLVRAVAQQDARRSVLRRTDSGARLLTEIRRIKGEVITEILSDWPDDEIGRFAETFDVFVTAFSRRLDP